MAKISGKVACITGALSGIGYEFAKYFLESGVKGLVLADMNEKIAPEVLRRLEKNGKAPIKFLKVDLTSMYDAECVLHAAIKEFDQLDIVINNAGILSETNYETMVKVNYVSALYGTMLALYKYLPKYKHGPEGVIVNTSSVFGLQPGHATPVYTACSNAIIGIGRAFGSDYYYNRYKSKVLTICPGITTTPLIERNKLNVDVLHFNDETKHYPKQEPVWCAKCLMKMLEEAGNGSVWIAEAEQCYEWPKEAFQFRTREEQSS